MIKDLSIKSTISLNNDVQIPRLGLGTYLASDGGEAKRAVLYALEIGYRHIDTARMYENEKDIGSAIIMDTKKSLMRLKEVWITCN